MLRSMDSLYEDVVWADENSSCDSELDLSSCFLTQAEVSVNVSTPVVYVKYYGIVILYIRLRSVPVDSH